MHQRVTGRLAWTTAVAALLLASNNAFGLWRIADDRVWDSRFLTPEEAHGYAGSHLALEEGLPIIKSRLIASPHEGILYSQHCFLVNLAENATLADANTNLWCAPNNDVYLRQWSRSVAWLDEPMEEHGIETPLERDTGEPIPTLCAGNPIHLGTGNKFHRETDYTAGGSDPLTFTRFYNSRSYRYRCAPRRVAAQLSPACPL